MGIGVEQWRQRIGTFSQPVRCSSAFPHLIVRSQYISLGIRILLFLMLVTQGVESNPGPGSRSNGSETSAANQIMTQTYGRGRGREQNASGLGRGNKGPGRRNRYDGYERRNFDGNDGSARRITRSQSERMGQSAITSWLGIPRPQPPG